MMFKKKVMYRVKSIVSFILSIISFILVKEQVYFFGFGFIGLGLYFWYLSKK